MVWYFTKLSIKNYIITVQFFDSYYLEKGSKLASLHPRSLHFNKNKLKKI